MRGNSQYFILVSQVIDDPDDTTVNLVFEYMNGGQLLTFDKKTRRYNLPNYREISAVHSYSPPVYISYMLCDILEVTKSIYIFATYLNFDHFIHHICTSVRDCNIFMPVAYVTEILNRRIYWCTYTGPFTRSVQQTLVVQFNSKARTEKLDQHGKLWALQLSGRRNLFVTLILSRNPSLPGRE